MFKTLFDGNDWLSLPVVSLLFFFLFFVGVLVWVYGRRRASHFDEVANMPLSDESEATES